MWSLHVRLWQATAQLASSFHHNDVALHCADTDACNLQDRSDKAELGTQAFFGNFNTFETLSIFKQQRPDNAAGKLALGFTVAAASAAVPASIIVVLRMLQPRKMSTCSTV
jgi:hypothetical protein